MAGARARLLELVVEAERTLHWLDIWAGNIEIELQDPIPSGGEFQRILRERMEKVECQMRSFGGAFGGACNVAEFLSEHED